MLLIVVVVDMVVEVVSGVFVVEVVVIETVLIDIVIPLSSKTELCPKPSTVTWFSKLNACLSKQIVF